MEKSNVTPLVQKDKDAKKETNLVSSLSLVLGTLNPNSFKSFFTAWNYNCTEWVCTVCCFFANN